MLIKLVGIGKVFKKKGSLEEKKAVLITTIGTIGKIEDCLAEV